MSSAELQAAYSEEPTPIVELAARQLRAMIHNYLNYVPTPVEMPAPMTTEGGNNAA